MIPAPADQFYRGEGNHASRNGDAGSESLRQIVDHPAHAAAASPQEPADYGFAIAFGLPASLAAGVAWGIVLPPALSWCGTILLGLAVMWVVRRGAGCVTVGVLVVAIICTALAIFVGRIAALSLSLSGSGVSIQDILAFYAEFVATRPVETTFDYGLGSLGASVGACFMWIYAVEQRAARQQRAIPTAPPVPIPEGGVSVLVLERTMTRVAAQLQFPPPDPHVLQVAYENVMGVATAVLDGVQVAQKRVWGAPDTTDVPVPGNPPRNVTIRFRGTLSPHIDLSVDGAPLATL